MTGEDVLGDQDGSAITSEGHPFDHQHRALRRHAEELGVGNTGQRGTDRLTSSAQRDRQQLLERCSFDCCLRQFGAEVFPAPDGDTGERATVGKVHSADFQHPGPQHWRDVGRRVDELEVEHPTL